MHLTTYSEPVLPVISSSCRVTWKVMNADSDRTRLRRRDSRPSYLKHGGQRKKTVEMMQTVTQPVELVRFAVSRLPRCIGNTPSASCAQKPMTDKWRQNVVTRRKISQLNCVSLIERQFQTSPSSKVRLASRTQLERHFSHDHFLQRNNQCHSP